MDLKKLLESLFGGKDPNSQPEEKSPPLGDASQINRELSKEVIEGNLIADTDLVEWQQACVSSKFCAMAPKLTPYDIYAASFALDMHVSEFAMKYVMLNVPKFKGLPMLAFNPKQNSPTCTFVRGEEGERERCCLGNNRPLSCKVRPLVPKVQEGKIELVDGANAIYGEGNYPKSDMPIPCLNYWEISNITQQAKESKIEYDTAFIKWAATYNTEKLTNQNLREILKIMFCFEEVVTVQKDAGIAIPPAKLQTLVVKALNQYFADLTSIQK